jgi:O-antigen ligase
VACVLAVVRPAVAVYFLTLIMPLESARVKLFDYPLGSRVVYLLMACTIIGILINRGSIMPPKLMRLRIAGLCITSFFSLWVGYMLLPSVPFPLATASILESSRTPFSYWLSFMQLPMLFVLVCAAIKDKRQVYILLLVMMLAFLWNAKNFHGNMAGRTTQAFSDGLRHAMGSDFGGSNGRAAYAAQATLFTFGVFSAIKMFRVRIVAALLICVGFYCVLFSYSRGAYLALALGLVYLALVRMRWLILVMVVALPFVGAIMPQSVIQRVTMTYQDDEMDASSETRLQIWKHALQTSLRDPVFGVGFDTYRYYRADEELHDTHNVYVKVYVETGVFGLAFLLALFGGAFFSARRLSIISTDEFDRALGLGFSAYMIAVIVTNLFGDRWTYPELSANTWILLALVVQGLVAHQKLSASPPLPLVEQPAPAPVRP